ncbi:response regulator transcription factor [Sphingomonas sp. LB-2]|uniref:winged helix-turn-helix domain-containing protein n=1 Tax=Sphingomonas caeni TaxID=2984949 RepID=UPI0022323AFD|nr:response regulator transcription factor [Sphingomonas caeni]MCW3847001.1 response regulator transcription factor [Sphingomonas caeni]
MTCIVACALDIPLLAAAVEQRGLTLVPMPRPSADAAAAVLGWSPAEGDPAARIADARAQGWRGALMLVLSQGCGASVAHALDAGADDAVLLPASAGEIAARIAARLRPALLEIGPLSIDTIERRVTRSGQPIRLLPREYALLLYLARARGRCVGRAELLVQVWGLRFDPGTNVIEVHVSRLRAKLDRGFPEPLLLTEKGRGYRLWSAHADGRRQPAPPSPASHRIPK